MRNPVDWVKRMLAEKPEQNHAPPASTGVQMGIVADGSNLILCPPDTQVRGLKLVNVSSTFVARYGRVITEYDDLQSELAALPVSLRKRKARKAKVSMPDETEYE